MSHQTVMEEFQAAGNDLAKLESFAFLRDHEHEEEAIGHHQTSRKKKKKGSKSNTKRFSDEQIRSLESMFESETKLEPRKKMELAKELGLQPRQVAIWFQNKRARWKGKQIEQEYRTLKANYDKLASNYESLKNERESLLSQLQRLSVLHDNNPRENQSINGNGNTTIFKAETEQGVESSSVHICSSDQNGQLRDHQEGHDYQDYFLNMGTEFNNVGYFASPYEKWFNFDSGSGVQFDLSCSSTSHFFNLWT